MAKTLSGQKTVRILVKYFGFTVTSQKGSHIKLKKWLEGGTVMTIVPNHKELASGTLRGVLRLAKVSEKDFRQYV